MNLSDLTNRVRSYTRDTTGTLFAQEDVRAFINEGIDRLRQIKSLETMKDLTQDTDVPNLLPPQYHYCLAVYGAYRCFSQDEQHYLSQTFGDEFNGLYALLELGIKEGTIVIVGEDGKPLENELDFDAVSNVYFGDFNG